MQRTAHSNETEMAGHALSPLSVMCRVLLIHAIFLSYWMTMGDQSVKISIIVCRALQRQIA